MAKYKLKLYITGRSAMAIQAIANLEVILQSKYTDQYDLEIIDILDRPQLAEDERIVATPMVVKELPEPIRQVIGDLSDRAQVLIGLDLTECESTATKLATKVVEL